MPCIGEQPVGNVDHRARTGDRGRFPFAHARDAAAVGADHVRVPLGERARGGIPTGCSKQRESGDCGAELSGHAQQIAALRTRAKHDATGSRLAQHGDRDDDRVGADRVPACDRHPVRARRFPDPVVQRLQHRDRRRRRRADRHRRVAGPAAHRGDVGDVNRQGFEPDVGRRREREVEVSALDEEVRRRERLGRRRHQRRVVAGRDDEVARREAREQPTYHLELAEIG